MLTFLLDSISDYVVFFHQVNKFAVISMVVWQNMNSYLSCFMAANQDFLDILIIFSHMETLLRTKGVKMWLLHALIYQQLLILLILDVVWFDSSLGEQLLKSHWRPRFFLCLPPWEGLCNCLCAVPCLSVSKSSHEVADAFLQTVQKAIIVHTTIDG